MFNDLTDRKLHYLASVYCTTTKKNHRRSWSVHAPLEEIEEEMIEDGLLETASEWYASYSWIDLRVTKYGKSVLKKIDPKVIALICLSMGDTVLMKYYTDKLNFQKQS